MLREFSDCIFRRERAIASPSVQDCSDAVTAVLAGRFFRSRWTKHIAAWADQNCPASDNVARVSLLVAEVVQPIDIENRNHPVVDLDQPGFLQDLESLTNPLPGCTNEVTKLIL